MEQNTFKKQFLIIIFLILGLTVFILPDTNAQKITVRLDLAKPGANVSPMLYGLMTEEINHSYDGGLYAELIRTFCKHNTVANREIK